MAKTTAVPAAPRAWIAKDVEELRSVWDELRLDSDDPATERHFCGRALQPEEAGDVFERWVIEAFRLSGATVMYPFEVPLTASGSTREQIDGLVFDRWQGFLVESKCWTGKVDFAPISLLHTLLDMRPDATMGLFLSAFGYTQSAEELASQLRPLRVMLFSRSDLEWALPPTNLSKAKAMKAFRGRMLAMVRRKLIFAIQSTRPNTRVEKDLALFNDSEE